MLLADISGFTALSERLARRGQVGAEELTDIVNTVVGRLLQVARPWGADLLKYGGDALLLLFSQDGHERRAVTTAAAMQSELRRLRHLRSESGRIDLRMSIGVESGAVDLFLAGDDHRELIVGGPVSSAVVRIQDLAAAGQVLLGPKVSRVLPERSRGPEAADGAYHLAASPVARRLRVADPEPSLSIVTGIPRALRPHLGTTDGEHRRAAVAFLRCGGLDELRAARGTSACAVALHDVVSVVQRACTAHGITFLGSDVADGATKLILVAGAPTTFGDNESRLVAALRQILDNPLPLPVRAGVHRGRVFAVEVGDEHRRVYTVLGDSVNLAARMMAAAPDGGLLATADVHERVRAPYLRTEVPPLSVKGKTEPVPAVLIGAPPRRLAVDDLLRDLGPIDGPFVGREPELRILTDAIRRSTTTRMSVVEVVGETGIGKSRLLAEACARTGLPVIVIHGRQYAAVDAYRAVRGPLRELLGVSRLDHSDELAAALGSEVRRLTPELEPMLPLLSVLFGLELPDTEQTAALAPDFRQDQIHAVALRFLDAFLPSSGVLVIEDPHWLDDGSSRLLSRLIGVMRHRRWAVLMARRTTAAGLEPHDVEVVRVDLAPLCGKSAKTLARLVGAGQSVEAVVERSGGNPLFLREIAAASAGGHAVEDLPDNVEAVIAAHLDTLPWQYREIVRVASVLGTHFTTEHLLDMLEPDVPNTSSRPNGVAGDVLTDLRSLEGVLEFDGTTRMRFGHALLQESAYAALSFRRRRQLHGKAADLIVGRTPDPERYAASLSLHYSAARRHRDCWRWSQVAAERARKDAAPVEAVTLFARALDSARHAKVSPHELADAYVRLGDVAELAGRYEKAMEAYRLARRLRADEPIPVADLYRRQGHVAEREGRYVIALQYYARGFRAIEYATEPEARRRAKVGLTLQCGAARLRQGRYTDAVRLLQKAVAGAEECGDRRALARAYYLLDWAYTDLGDPHPEYRELALPIYQDLGDLEGQANVLNNLGVDAYYEGRWEAALAYYRRSREAVERIGNANLAAIATNNIGEILCDQGHLAQARTEFKSALEVWTLSGYTVGIGLATANLGRVAARSGEFEAGARLIDKAIATLRRIGADSVVVDAECREVERLVLAADPKRAMVLAEMALERADQPVQRAHLDRMIGHAYDQTDRPEAAVVHYQASLETARAAGADYEEARTLVALLRLEHAWLGHGYELLRDRCERASQILDRLGVVWLTAPPFLYVR